jgi:hypothetical protein
MHLLALPLLASAACALMVPSPPGPYSVAVKHFELADSNRTDSLAPNPNITRRFMSSVYLPIDTGYECKSQTVPYMPRLTAKVFGQMGEQLGVPQGTLEQFEMDYCDLSTITLDMDASAEKKRYPVAIFSPGYGGTRLVYGAMARSLASLGYVVFTVDHTYEASVVQFPDGSDEYSADLGLGNMTTTLEQLEVRQERFTAPKRPTRCLTGDVRLTKPNTDASWRHILPHFPTVQHHLHDLHPSQLPRHLQPQQSRSLRPFLRRCHRRGRHSAQSRRHRRSELRRYNLRPRQRARLQRQAVRPSSVDEKSHATGLATNPRMEPIL